MNNAEPSQCSVSPQGVSSNIPVFADIGIIADFIPSVSQAVCMMPVETKRKVIFPE
jgi:hypothetical protein